MFSLEFLERLEDEADSRIEDLMRRLHPSIRSVEEEIAFAEHAGDMARAGRLRSMREQLFDVPPTLHVTRLIEKKSDTARLRELEEREQQRILFLEAVSRYAIADVCRSNTSRANVLTQTWNLSQRLTTRVMENVVAQLKQYRIPRSYGTDRMVEYSRILLWTLVEHGQAIAYKPRDAQRSTLD